MGPILNKKVAEKCNLWDRKQYTDTLFTVDKINYWTKKKKKKEGEKRSSKNVDAEIIWIQTVIKFSYWTVSDLHHSRWNLGLSYWCWQWDWHSSHSFPYNQCLLLLGLFLYLRYDRSWRTSYYYYFFFS